MSFNPALTTDQVTQMVLHSLRTFSNGCNGERYEDWTPTDAYERVKFAIQDLPVTLGTCNDENQIARWYNKHWLIFAFAGTYNECTPVQHEIVGAIVWQAFKFYQLTRKLM